VILHDISVFVELVRKSVFHFPFYDESRCMSDRADSNIPHIYINQIIVLYVGSRFWYGIRPIRCSGGRLTESRSSSNSCVNLRNDLFCNEIRTCSYPDILRLHLAIDTFIIAYVIPGPYKFVVSLPVRILQLVLHQFIPWHNRNRPICVLQQPFRAYSQHTGIQWFFRLIPGCDWPDQGLPVVHPFIDLIDLVPVGRLSSILRNLILSLSCSLTIVYDVECCYLFGIEDPCADLLQQVYCSVIISPLELLFWRTAAWKGNNQNNKNRSYSFHR